MVRAVTSSYVALAAQAAWLLALTPFLPAQRGLEEFGAWTIPMSVASYLRLLDAVVRDYPSLRETGGPGALDATGNDPAAWDRAIAKSISDPVRHAELREARRRHAQRFSWDASAAALVDDRLHSHGPGPA
jgi:glycosyltransferase involved in cell wall biosynthesis